MNKTLLPVVLVVSLLSGCKLTPKYVRPPTPVPNAWPTGDAYSATADGTNAPSAADLRWQAFFTDAKLRQIIAGSLTNNLDLRIALLKVEQMRALYGVQRDELYPSLSANADLSKARVPADLSSTGHRHTTTRYDVNLGVASWEIDFFGRVRALKDQALEEYLASEQARRNAQILLISSIASTYLALAADLESQRLSETTLKAQEDSYTLIKRRYDIGVVTELDLYRAQTQVDTARGNVAQYKQQVAEDINALNLLAGEPIPDGLLPARLDDITPPRAISAGTPSDVLLLRPDIAQAEALLRAANADIGAARAAFFPSISLTAFAGTASSELSGLFKGQSGAWNYAPQVGMPIFDARTWSAFRVAKSQQKLALTQYELAIQSAFKEVADALAVRGTIGERVNAQQSLVNAMEATYRLSSSRYDKGIDSYLSVLDAQRSLYSAQQALVSLRQAQAASLIHLYAVLGGGAEDETKQPLPSVSARPVPAAASSAPTAQMAPLLKAP